jgi:outer membrane beta-barrel protein
MTFLFAPLTRPTVTALLALLALAAGAARAADAPAPGGAQQPANEQVVVPTVDRREVRVPKIPSNDFEVGLLAGTYSTQNFGASAVYGLRLGYHITEDVFVEAAYGRTRVSDEDFRQILPGGVFVTPKQTLTYYNLSAGYNILPGEVFLGSRYAKASALYLIGGVGSTRFVQQRKQTFNFGVGLRVFVRDWAAVQVDVRDHLFNLDLLGRNRSTQNIELTTGVTFFF